MPMPVANGPTLAGDDLRHLIDRQVGLVTRAQLTRAGYPPEHGRSNLRAGRWREVFPGIYLTTSGLVTYPMRCWTAVLAAGPGAGVSGATAAYLNGTSPLRPHVIDVVVPDGRRVRAPRGVRVRRTVRPLDLLGGPPRTSIPTTALDLASTAGSDGAVVGFLAEAARQLGGLGQLRRERGLRRWIRHSILIDALLTPASEGIASALELRFDRRVLRAHGLPAFERRSREVLPDGAILAVVVSRFRTRCHLDGRLHLAPEGDDAWRANAVAISTGDLALRYYWQHVAGRPCRVAEQLAHALTRGGWQGSARACGPACVLTSPAREPGLLAPPTGGRGEGGPRLAG